MIQWWGYQHTNGSLQVKRFFSWEDISEARMSPFVREAYGPWNVENHEGALEKLRECIEG